MSLFFICSPCLFGVWSKLSYCCNHCYRPISDNYLFVVRHTISNYSRLHSKFIWFPPIKMQRVLKKRKKKKKKSFFFFLKWFVPAGQAEERSATFDIWADVRTNVQDNSRIVAMAAAVVEMKSAQFSGVSWVGVVWQSATLLSIST